MTKHSPQLLCVLHGHSTLLMFATFKSLMQINTHDIDDLLTRGASLHTFNQHLADRHHILTYKALTCKYHRASQAGSSCPICAIAALNSSCVHLAFQLKAKEDVEGHFEVFLFGKDGECKCTFQLKL